MIMPILRFRKLFKEKMMRSGKAERIIVIIYILRKAFKYIMFLAHLRLRGVIVSYFFQDFSWEVLFHHIFLVVWLLFVLRGSVSSYSLLPLFPLLTTNVQENLTPFLPGQNLKEAEKETDAYFVEEFKDGKGVRAAAYIRVSTGKQVQGFSLAAQTDELRRLARKRGVSRLYWVMDPGKSGLDFDKRRLDEILELAATKEINELLVVDVDRIGRNSRKLMDFFLDLRDCGVIIVTPQGEMDVDDLAGLMMAALRSWAAQYENERRARASVAGRIQAFLKKRWNKPVPKGYRKRENGWIEKDNAWKLVIEDVFSLFLRYKNYRVVTDAVNAKYASFLSKPLTRQQIAAILRNPVYVGKPRYSGKVVEKQFQKVVVDDPDLVHINKATFERAQRIIGRIRQRHRHKDNVKLKTMINKYGVKVLDFLRHVVVMCSNCKCLNCKAIMVENGNPEQKNYICKNCGRQLRVPKKTEIKKIEESHSKNKRLPKSGTTGSSKASSNLKNKSSKKRKLDKAGISTTLDNYFLNASYTSKI